MTGIPSDLVRPSNFWGELGSELKKTSSVYCWAHNFLLASLETWSFFFFWVGNVSNVSLRYCVINNTFSHNSLSLERIRTCLVKRGPIRYRFGAPLCYLGVSAFLVIKADNTAWKGLIWALVCTLLNGYNVTSIFTWNERAHWPT